MYSPNSLHEKVMKEFQKKQAKRQAIIQGRLNEIYDLFPRIRQIDNDISMLAVKHAARILSEGITPEDAVKSVNAEKEILVAERKALLSNSGFADNNIAYECDLCKDTGIYNGQKCKCYMEAMKKIMLQNIDGSMSTSFDFEKDTFDNFSLKWYSKNTDNSKINISPYDNMQAVYRECRMFCADFGKENKNLYFYGSSGTGKTFMANCIANELIAKGFSVVYQSAYKLFQFMEDYKFCRIDRNDNISNHDSIYNCDLLIIDDLGTEFGTAYTCSVLFDILNTRLLNEKSTVISTNLSLTNLEKKYTDRVASRIIGNFEVMRFMGDDIRIAKKRSGR